MTARNFISTVIILAVITAFQIVPDKVVFRGQLASWDKDTKKEFIGLHAIIKGDGHFLVRTLIDTSGLFVLNFPTTSYKTFDLLVAGIGVDTSFVATFSSFNSDTLDYKTNFPMGLEFQIFRCPKCKYEDKAYDIIYGDNQKVKMTIVKGDTIYSNVVNRKYYAGTCLSSNLSPHYYCDRCKIKW